MSEAKPLDHLPVASRVRVDRRALEEKARGTVAQRAIHHVAVPSDPTDICHTAKEIARLIVKASLGERKRKDGRRKNRKSSL